MPQPNYLPGVPCWVETLQPDPRSALAFYSQLFGWEGKGPASTPDGGEYYVAHLDGGDVAGIAALPANGIAEPAWTTYVRVDELEPAVERVRAAGGAVIVGPLDVKPAGRIAIVADPGGATFGLSEPDERIGAQRINQPGAWAMSTLHTRNLAAAKTFYGAAFDWNAEPFGPSTTLFRLTGYVGGLPQQPVPRDVVAVALENPDSRLDHWSVDFWIHDIDAAVGRIEEHAGTVIRGPFDVPMFRRAVVSDPAGAICTISQLVPERRA